MKRVFGFRLPSLPLADVTVVTARPHAVPATCSACDAVLLAAPRYARYRVCDACGYHDRIAARETIAHLVDPGTFRETDPRLGTTDPLAFVDDVAYRDRLDEQRARTGEVDAIVTGTARLHGHPMVLAVLDFAFMGGSMGVVVGEKVARAAERARRERRPLVTVAASGGARVQEGMLSLLQMAKTAGAVKRLRDAGLPYLSVLSNPTTGGVYASFASLGDVIVAEPKALIGFAGPRVAEQVIGHPLPPGSNTAEFLLAHGMIDAVVERHRLRAHLGTLLDILAAPRTGYRPRGDRATTAPELPVDDPWDAVQGARDPARPTSVDYLARMLDGFVELHGDRCWRDDPAVVAGVGLLDGRGLAVVALERGHGGGGERHGGRAFPEGYRKAQRVMRLAARLGLPLLTLIDTPGAYPGVEAEERGLAGELAASLALMSDLPTPVVAAIIGEGGSGGALALAVADRVLMQAGAIYSVIAPEGAAVILYRDPSRAAEVSAKLRLTATGLRQRGIVDAVVPEPPGGARADPDAAAVLLKAAVVGAFADLQRRSPERLVSDRFARYQEVGRAYVRDVRVRRAGRSVRTLGLVPRPAPATSC